MKTQQLHLNLINVLVDPAQGTTAAVIALHRAASVGDPAFYGRLANWSQSANLPADQRLLIITNLLAAEAPRLRQLGAVQLQQLEPRNVSRVLSLLKTEFGKIPRSTKTAVTLYLRTLEDDPVQFDLAAFTAGGALKHLYAALRIKPEARADNILFKKTFPKDSLQNGLKSLAAATDKGEAADIVLNHQIPFQAAAGAVSQMDHVVLAVLIALMPAREVEARMRKLKAQGALDHPGVRAIIDEKLKQVGDNPKPDQTLGKDAATILAQIQAMPDLDHDDAELTA